ncbi:MAG: hypothetical protein DMF98_06480 [Acidobacteria bacterium]|nr:MAG: hypothetical protein DMF98_06480 [Acidobacteriota bacterium]
MVDDDLWYAPLLKTARVVPREPEPLWEIRSAEAVAWADGERAHLEQVCDAQLHLPGSIRPSRKNGGLSR